jgi:hypothetical protein
VDGEILIFLPFKRKARLLNPAQIVAVKTGAKEPAMLLVDLNDSDYQIAQFIKVSCLAFGRVKSVKIHRSPVPFALIEMSSREQTFELAARYGGSTFGTCALVHLGQLANAHPDRLRAAA